MNEDKVYSDAHEVFTRFLAGRHLRKTPERFAILKLVMSQPGHFAIDTLTQALSTGPMTVSRGTIYNTVSLLLDCGLLRCHHFDSRQPQYEAIVGRRPNHLHLVCTRCGKVREVPDTEIERIIKSRRYDTFHPGYFALSIYGVCSRCLRKKRRAAKKSG